MTFDLAAFAAECHVKDISGFIAGCARLRELLEEANKITNLTRILGEQDFAVKHAADSLSIGKFFPELAEKPLRIADIGCGAGFPSLILALAYPQLQITSIDSTGKKIAFVADAAKQLALPNLTAIHGRANELNRKQEYMRKFDIVTARAVAEAASICKDTAKFPVPKGRYIFYQSPERAAADAAKLPQMRYNITPAFELPESAGQRCFLEIFPAK